MYRVDKSWGYENVIYNTDLYCMKILHFNPNTSGSLHFHKLKQETWYISAGIINLQLHDNLIELNVGDSLTIYPEVAHQVFTDGGAEIFECSTTHFDTDTYRI